MGGRNYGIDLLRLLAMFFVVLLHQLLLSGGLEPGGLPQVYGVFWLLEVVAYGALLLRCISPFYVLCCFNQVYAAALRGAGNSKATMIIMLCSFVLFRQVYLFIMSHYISHELIPLVMGYPAGWLVCSAATLIYYRRTSFLSTRLVAEDGSKEDIQ